MHINTHKKSDLKVKYPSNKEVVSRLIKISSQGDREAFLEQNKMVLQRVELLRDSLRNYDNKKISHIFSHDGLHGPLASEGLDSLVRALKKRWQLPNEFFTVFDISSGREIFIDESMNNILGIRNEDFQTMSIQALNTNESLYHRNEMFHIIRHDIIAYMMTSLPFFSWAPYKGYYQAKFRIRTNKSQDAELRRKESVSLDRKAFVVGTEKVKGSFIATFHFDIYSVIFDKEFNYPRFQFVSVADDIHIKNAALYLINALLLDVPVKYLLMLDEKRKFDRYKAVAQRMEEKILKFSGRTLKIGEQKIADCFSKTIRTRIEQTFNRWDQRYFADRVSVSSDAKAIHYAHILGLLPIPHLVKQLYYSMVYSD